MAAVYWLFVVGIASLSLGFSLGYHARESSLAVGPDHRGITGAHHIKGRFWYLVPERAYNGLLSDHYHLKNLGKTTHDALDD
jgi:hypothetical protein